MDTRPHEKQTNESINQSKMTIRNWLPPSRRFSGLMSRWITFILWQYIKASVNSAMYYAKNKTDWQKNHQRIEFFHLPSTPHFPQISPHSAISWTILHTRRIPRWGRFVCHPKNIRTSWGCYRGAVGPEFQSPAAACSPVWPPSAPSWTAPSTPRWIYAFSPARGTPVRICLCPAVSRCRSCPRSTCWPHFRRRYSAWAFPAVPVLF